MKKIVIMTCSVCFLVVLGYFFMQNIDKPSDNRQIMTIPTDSDSTKTGTHQTDSKDNTDRVQENFAAMQLELSALKSQINKMQQKAANQPSGKPVGDEIKNSDSDKSTQPGKADVADQAQNPSGEPSIDQYFDQQSADDSTLDYGSQDIVQDAFDQLDQQGSELVDVVCRSEVCRLEVIHKDAEARESLPQEIAIKMGDDIKEIVVKDQDDKEGNAPVVMYIARDNGSEETK